MSSLIHHIVEKDELVVVQGVVSLPAAVGTAAANFDAAFIPAAVKSVTMIPTNRTVDDNFMPVMLFLRSAGAPVIFTPGMIADGFAAYIYNQNGVAKNVTVTITCVLSR